MESGKHLLNKIIATEFPAMKVSKQRKVHTNLSVCAFINGKEYQNVANISMKKILEYELEAQLIIWLSRLTVWGFFLLQEWHKFLFHNSSGTGSYSYGYRKTVTHVSQ